MSLSQKEKQRYLRHLIMPEVGQVGQERLLKSSVAIVGLGGLGSPAAYYLAAAGVGRLGLFDFDRVDRTNLHRQILHFDTDVDRPKSESASEKLRALNPDIEVETHEVRLSSQNALDLLRPYDVVLDGTDNFATRYLVNDACVLLGKPNVYGSIFRFDGQVSVFWAGKGPCYRCLYPEPPPPGSVPTCAEAGVLGVLPGMVGTIQATEALKLLLDLGEPLIGQLLMIDALRMEMRSFRIRASEECPICGPKAHIRELQDYESFCNAARGPQSRKRLVPSVTVQQLQSVLVSGRPHTLLDVREIHEREIAVIHPSVHIPVSEVPAKLHLLDKNSEIYVICHSGMRSHAIASFLIDQGFTNVANVEGGIDAWSEEIDPTVPSY